MNVKIGAEAAQFQEKKYINEIAVAVWIRAYPGNQSETNLLIVGLVAETITLH